MSAKDSAEPLSNAENMNYVGIYAAITSSAVVFLSIKSVGSLFHSISASRAVHTAMLSGITTAPLSFFDSTPIGRILNRFSSDMKKVDDPLAVVSLLSMTIAFAIIGAIVAMLISTQGIMLVLLVPLLVLYIFILKYYKRTKKQVRT